MAQVSKAGPIKKVTDALPTDVKKVAGALPTEALTQELKNLAQAFIERALRSVSDKVEDVAGRLADPSAGSGVGGLFSALTGSDDSGGKSVKRSMIGGAIKGAIKGLFSGMTKGTKKLRFINIVESIDVGAPVRVVYNQWTQFQDFPTFMKKVEHVENESDEKLSWKTQIFWSHRSWESHIVEQVPDERIIWRSKGPKGYVDGAVTFHAVTPNLTRVLLVLEYHPKGLVEHVGNMWRAQGRRVRLEFKHFRRHVMTQAMLHPDEVASDGWRGVIHDGEVVKDHETASQEEQAAQEEEEERPEEERPEEERAEEERAEEERPEEEPEEEEEEGEEGEELPEDELEEEEEEEEEPEEEEEEEPEEEEEEEEEEPPRAASRRRGRAQEPQSRPVRRRAGSRTT
ncbi:SRPBCC family protein [Nonomuraea aurantiaca]|uniref:SRPBCC family protein n=1 Tax=Nonomuraea aurantiaca TaxID=2878562 RepID=UPI001CD9FEF0|nr:SRPBCC family protein [Nonomuraea aurantiaca]MCA2225696.1 SRPBCC family protein [Nonomuraea aurantiaca]